MTEDDTDLQANTLVLYLKIMSLLPLFHFQAN